jgi:hypothetical protein
MPQVNEDQFQGVIHPRHLIPTENTSQNESGPAGVKYQNDLTEHIANHGFTSPIEAFYSDRGQYGIGRKQKPKLYIQQGHHRHSAAKSLGIKVPVTVKSIAGRPSELES